MRPERSEVADEKPYEKARKKVETGEDGAEWYFTLAETTVAKAPGDTGEPITKVGTVAMPLISAYPPAKEGEAAPQPTYIEVLLPSGKSRLDSGRFGSAAGHRSGVLRKNSQWRMEDRLHRQGRVTYFAAAALPLVGQIGCAKRVTGGAARVCVVTFDA